MIKVIVALLCLAGILSGCTGESGVSEEFSVSEGFGVSEKSGISEGFGISSEANLDNLYPGWSGTAVLNVVNGQDSERTIVLYVMSPSRPDEGYEAFPEEYLSWFTIENDTFDMTIGEVREVIINIDIPEDVDYVGKKAEVRIHADDVTQTGLIRVAVESKWYITTAK